MNPIAEGVQGVQEVNPPRTQSAPNVADVSPGPARENLRGHLIRGSVRLGLLLALDMGTIVVARGILRQVRQGGAGAPLGDLATALFPTTIAGLQLAVAVAVSMLFMGCYRSGDYWKDPVRVLTASGAGVVLAFYSDVWHGDAPTAIASGLALWAVMGPLLVATRAGANAVTRRFPGPRMRHRILEIQGEGAVGDPWSLGPSYDFVASLDGERLSADVGSMERWLDGGVDTILIRGEVTSEKFEALTDFALTHGCRLLCLPRSARLLGVETKRVWMEGHPLSELTAPGMRASHLVLKRVFDLIVAITTLILLSPLLLFVALLVRLDSEGPILFTQRRPGMQGLWFPMLKFRSMRTDAEEALKSDPALYELFLQNDCKLPEDVDPRITRIGRFLRKTSLDEIPQLINVVRGDMSLVGPRPLVGPELENYTGRIPTLLSVRPGITGLWQVSGRSSVTFPERAQMDLEYVRKWSFLGDLWILTLTPVAVLVRKGAF